MRFTKGNTCEHRHTFGGFDNPPSGEALCFLTRMITVTLMLKPISEADLASEQ